MHSRSVKVQHFASATHIALKMPDEPSFYLFKQGLPLSFHASINGNRWVGQALLPWRYFPPGVNKMNSYAIHGSGEARTYEALYPVPRDDIEAGQKPNL